MSDKTKLDDLAASLNAQQSEQKLPPVEKWNPPFCGDLDMHIHRDGRWFYLGSEIKRHALVKLFSTILLRQGADYFLVTPVEKYRIKVDDAPFVAVEVNVLEGQSGTNLQFRTNTDDLVVADQAHPLRVMVDPVTGEPAPYILVRKNLEALVSRNVFYQLVELATTNSDDQNELFVSSSGNRFSLGRLE